MKKRIIVIGLSVLFVFITVVSVGSSAYTIFQYYDNYVYVTSNVKEKYWHTYNDCDPTRNADKITLREAVNRGYEKCSKCGNNIYQQTPIGKYNEDTKNNNSVTTNESPIDDICKILSAIGSTLAAIMGVLFMLVLAWGMIAEPIIEKVKESRRIKRLKAEEAKIEKIRQKQKRIEEKSKVEFVYCPECGASYMKGKTSNKCAECGYVFDTKVDNRKNRKCYCIDKSKLPNGSLNENRYVKAFVDIYHKLRRLAINIPVFDTPDMELLSFLYAMTDYFAFQKQYSETKRSEISDILIKALTDTFGCNEQQIDLVIKRNSLYSEFIRGRKPVGFCFLNTLEYPNGIARCYAGLCDLMVDHEFYDDESSPLPLVDIINCYAVNNFAFKLADILEVYYNAL